MKKRVIGFFILAGLIIANSCSNVTEPEPQPGRRDYMWKVDTINPGNESLSLGRIWGSSPEDVWAVGSSSWTATSIWHFNGKQWRCDSIPRRVAANGLFGISQNDVWLGSCCGLNTIWRYNGNNWYQYAELIPEEGYNQIFIDYFDGLQYNNVYGVGSLVKYPSEEYKGMIMNFNGIEWKYLKIPKVKTQFTAVVVDPKSKDLVIAALGMTPERYFSSHVYSWDGKELKELASELGGWSHVTKLGGEIFAYMNRKIYKYENKQLTLWKNNSGSNIYGNIICGRSRNDFFIGSDEGIMHYNGTDFSTIYQTSLAVRRGYIFENDVFIIGLDEIGGKNYIIHGKLK